MMDDIEFVQTILNQMKFDELTEEEKKEFLSELILEKKQGKYRVMGMLIKHVNYKGLDLCFDDECVEQWVSKYKK